MQEAEQQSFCTGSVEENENVEDYTLAQEDALNRFANVDDLNDYCGKELGANVSDRSFYFLSV